MCLCQYVGVLCWGVGGVSSLCVYVCVCVCVCVCEREREKGGGEIWGLSRLLDGHVFIIKPIIPSRSGGGGGGVEGFRGGEGGRVVDGKLWKLLVT